MKPNTLLDKGYPPEYDAPCICQVCNKDVDECNCPECPECGEVGNPTCTINQKTVPAPFPEGVIDVCWIETTMQVYLTFKDNSVILYPPDPKRKEI